MVPAPKQAPEPFQPDTLAARTRWLIGHRFIAVGGVVAAVGVAASIGAVDAPWVLLATAGVLAACNLLFRRSCARAAEAGSVERLRLLIAVQLVIDLLALTVLLHFAGGVDNPFALFYFFHVTIGALILPLSWAASLAALALVLPLSMAWATGIGLLAAHPLRLGGQLWGSATAIAQTPASYLIGRALAYAVTVGGLLFFVASIGRRLRQTEARRLQHAQVAASRERLARIGAIAGGVAHTIRNPLHGVLNCVSMLGDEIDPLSPESAEQRELVALALEGVDRIEKVTRRLQALRQDTPFRREPVQLGAVAAECLKFMEVRAREAGVTLDLALQEVPLIEADSNRLAEALLNLLDNAIYACNDSGTVTVRVGPVDDERRGEGGAWVRIEVADTGSGIDPGMREEIFSPFVTTKPMGEGSGLGLAIVRRVAIEHGGQVDIDGALGHGTIVRLDLPCDIAGPIDA